jgi:uncharacterized membrane protein
MSAIYALSMVMLYLACYSFLGWVAEEIFVLGTTQKLENRGFLTGPFLPIYGIGAIALILLVEPYVTNPFAVFVACVVITSAIEYVGSLILSTIFHISLWDYSDQKFNLHGRICLRNSLLFGGLGLLLIYVLQPIISDVLSSLEEDAAIALAWTLIGILVIDSANSIRSLAKVRPVLDELQGTLAEAHSRIEERAVRAEETVAEQQAARRSARQSTLGRLSRTFPAARFTRLKHPPIAMDDPSHGSAPQ